MALYSTIINYLETVAQYHPDLLHSSSTPCFFRSPEAAMNAYKGTSRKLPMVFVGTYDSNYANDSDALKKRIFVELYFMTTRPVNNESEMASTFDTLEDIIDKWINRVHHDSTAHLSTAAGPLSPAHMFEIDTIRSEQIIAEGQMMGYLVSFTIIAPHARTYTAGDWADA